MHEICFIIFICIHDIFDLVCFPYELQRTPPFRNESILSRFIHQPAINQFICCKFHSDCIGLVSMRKEKYAASPGMLYFNCCNVCSRFIWWFAAPDEFCTGSNGTPYKKNAYHLCCCSNLFDNGKIITAKAAVSITIFPYNNCNNREKPVLSRFSRQLPNGRFTTTIPQQSLWQLPVLFIIRNTADVIVFINKNNLRLVFLRFICIHLAVCHDNYMVADLHLSCRRTV